MILNKSIVIGEELKKDIAIVMESNAEKFIPFMKLFWGEQKKLPVVIQMQSSIIL